MPWVVSIEKDHLVEQPLVPADPSSPVVALPARASLGEARFATHEEVLWFVLNLRRHNRRVHVDVREEE